MKTFHRFDKSVGRERAARVARNGRILASKAAREAASKNPAIIWVDAAMSLLDAANAYFRLARENERLRALQRLTASLNAELDSVLKAMDVDQRLWRRKSQAQKEGLGRALAADDSRLGRLMAEMRGDRTILKSLREALAQVRQTSDRSLEALENLQNEFDAFLLVTIDARIALYQKEDRS